VDERALTQVEESLRRCNTDPGFLDRFYERFLTSSSKVREKFAGTDFVRQKRMLQASLQLLLVAAQDDGKRPTPYLDAVAARHSASQMAIGAELYDLWLDSLLSTVREVDPGWNAEVEDAWERVMTIGIAYLVTRFNRPPGEE
jgi:hemoglobin-like flavoprotein